MLLAAFALPFRYNRKPIEQHFYSNECVSMWVSRVREHTPPDVHFSRYFSIRSLFSTSNLATKLFAQSAVRERKMRIVYRRKENLS